MMKNFNDNFVERNGFIPLAELENSRFKPQDFALASITRQIKAEGLNPEDFYFNPGKTETPYCYYKGVVIMDFSALDGKLDEIKSLISTENQNINDTVAQRNFDRFLTLVDPRLAPNLFMEVFNFIPDEDKFRLFERLWNYNENSREVFSQDFIKKVSKYKGVISSQPVADELGYVHVYTWEPQGQIWTTDVNIAIVRVLSLPSPRVFQGRVHSDQIISYNNHRSKREVKVYPHQVMQVEIMDLIDLGTFDDEMRSAGIIEQYEAYAGQIDKSWFHNPEGIHAVSHTKRVLMLSLIISYLERYSEQDRTILALASIYHDIGRTNDGYDPDHGVASYDKLVQEGLIPRAEGGDEEILKFIIQNHAIPDQSAYKKLNRYNLSDVNRNIRLYHAFKDADGLDRVRIKDLNPEYLRTGSAPRLLLAAHQLYCERVIY
jgi:hypothetical protein